MNVFETRKPNIFEHGLLITGLLVIVFGFILINKMYAIEGSLNWNLLVASFLWLIIILLLVLASTSQDIKEELCIIVKETNEEIKLLRKELSKRQ